MAKVIKTSLPNFDPVKEYEVKDECEIIPTGTKKGYLVTDDTGNTYYVNEDDITQVIDK